MTDLTQREQSIEVAQAMNPEWQTLRESGSTIDEIADDFNVSTSEVSRNTEPPKNKIKKGRFTKHNYDDNSFKKPTAAACIPKPNFMLGKAGGWHWGKV